MAKRQTETLAPGLKVGRMTQTIWITWVAFLAGLSGLIRKLNDPDVTQAIQLITCLLE